ncbi:MAG TPA: hypothetical protein VMV29_09685, partial [Ktedonobacterales bacterium]|nr:hypothetical protein [Ktedonobacterales bacterium]
MLVALAEVEGVYQACLRKQAEARPSANEVLARLQQAASRLGQTPYTPTAVYPHTPEHEMIAWHNWASTYYSFGLYEEALERNDRAVALAPTNPEMLLERGDILAALNCQEEALTVYDTALAALPPDEVMLRTSLWNNRGARLHELMRYAEAEASFAQALALLPTDADAWCNRGENQRLWGRAEAQAGHFDTALFHWRTGIKYVEQAIMINSHHPKYHQVLDLLRDAPGSGGGQ